MTDKFARAFVMEKQGSWFCREAVQILGPHGPATTTPGVTYRSGTRLLQNVYDVAAWLDSLAATGKGPVGIEFL
jgi:hypothetical protein